MGSTSNYANILAAIKTAMEGIDNIGKVHDYERWAIKYSKILSFFRESDLSPILAWTISRTSSREDELSAGSHERVHTFTIRGYRSLKDSTATEKTFQGLVEDICDVFRPAELITLDGTCFYIKPMQVVRVEQVMFVEVLCHYAELTVNVYENLENL